MWGERGENMIRFSLESSAVLPFERNYYIRPETGGAEDIGSPGEVLCWFVQRDKTALLDERGMPDYLAFAEDGILFLH